ncbi:MBL fold metallo-hydrolase [Roseospira visakhapatnamensis]|uniref:Glyoxylase-like metal-dependent hydrolase (Beta-lactamase superfamily II) n=1 Tax=Roseospira visakhapatnamensis TaxID=390880 RepID=A0A7W6RB50_9PROT|nr:MBL fold metallo-hydrolase [Roseospira visakhapatnamensis]MBB4265170.1 glyoxylase-like metal-dependent hydrolase (beta-lactamase superfamily II) [Roseospira visakhapatnamensis]
MSAHPAPPNVAFASTGDLGDKTVTFAKLGEGAYAYTAEGDPNTGVIIGDDGVMVIDTQATPVMAAGVLEKIRAVTDKPVKYVLLTHYHAVRVLGASAYQAQAIIASRGTHEMILERGQEDYDSEAGRFPRLFQGLDSIPGLTWPTVVFDDRLTVDLGNRRVEILHPGKGHTQGDTVAWLPGERILYAGDLVEHNATPYTGDAHLAEWPETLRRLRDMKPNRLVPGRGDALMTPGDCEAAIAMTEAFVSDLFETAREGVALNQDLRTVYRRCRDRMDAKYGHWVIYDHCMPFDVTRAWDEARGIRRPRTWTADRDRDMWAALEGE